MLFTNFIGNISKNIPKNIKENWFYILLFSLGIVFIVVFHHSISEVYLAALNEICEDFYEIANSINNTHKPSK